MIRIFKNKSKDDQSIPTHDMADPDMQPKAVRDALHRSAEDNPFVHQQVTGRELYANIILALSEEKRARRAETGLAVMASLAGFSCLSSVYLKYERGEISPDADGFRVEVTPSGRRVFFGDLITERLLEGETSVWGMVSQAAKKLGAIKLPDIEEISDHVATTYANGVYGVPRVPEANQPLDIPSNFVRYLMPSYLPLLQKYDSNAEKFAISFGYAIQNLMEESCEDLDPAMAAKLAMECAIPMATLDPAEVF